MIGLHAKYPWVPVLSAVMTVAVSRSPASAQREYPKEIHQDFRGKRPLVDDLKLVGPGRDEACKREDEGLRITLPKTRKWFEPTGVRLQFNLAGDFEITGTYELVSIDQPGTGGGAGVAVNVVNPNSFSRFGHFLLPDKGSVYVAECRASIDPRIRPDEHKVKSVPTKTRTGRLRLIRAGSRLRFLAAEGQEEEFREILDAEFSAAEVDTVRFQVANNGSQTLTDARLVDWKIRYGNAGPPAPPAAPMEKQAEPPPRGWLMAFLLVGAGFVVLIAVALAAAFFLLQRRGAGKAKL